MLQALTLLATWLISSTMAEELRLSSLSFPQLDLSSFNNGEIGLLGDFDAATQYKYKGTSNFTNQNTLTNNLYYTEGANEHFITLGEVQGSISSILPITSDTFLLLGNFTDIGDHSVSSPALFNITSNDFTALDPDSEIDGTVTTGYYDSSSSLIYLGGDFTYNDTASAAYYNLTGSSLHSMLFEGFGDDSHINSIIGVGENIVFGGQFDTLGLPELLSATYNASNTSVQYDQLVSLKHATFSSSDGSSSPDNLACTGGDEWSVPGVTSATLNVNLPYTVIPSKVRLYNSNDEDSQISMFRMITSPAGSIMNLTYVDPSTGELAYCDAWCPLLDSSSLSDDIDANGITALPFDETTLTYSTSFQDFGFVNELSVSAVVFQALDSYGDAIALGGFEIYQSVFSTYANNTLNEPACSSASEYSYADITGDWEVSSDGNYMITTQDITGGVPEVGVTFYPNISYSGDYTVMLYTPGCSSDGTCDSRGIVNVTVYDNDSSDLLQTSLIYQTNQNEKYDTLLQGHLDGGIRVEMFMYSTVLGGSDDEITMVADRLTVRIDSIDGVVNANGTVNINGIFEYSPANFTNFNAANLSESTLVGNTTINMLGSSLSDGADVQLVYLDNTIYVGGEFESDYGDNFFVISVDEDSSSVIDADVSSVDGGLDGAVSAMKAVDGAVVVVGEFDGTNNQTDVTALSDSDDLAGAAMYNGSWYAFGSVDSDSITNITLKDSDFVSFDNKTWSFDNNTWYSGSSLLSFNVSAAGSNGDVTLFTGALKVSDMVANKGIFLSNTTLEANITGETLTNSSIITGVFINESVSAFGGEFFTESGLTNLIIVSGNDTTGIDIDWDDDSSVTKLFAYNGKLFIGANGGGSVSDGDFDGVVVYNMENDTLTPIGSLSGSVNEFGYFNDTYLVVGGDFSSDECSGLCFYNMNETSWTQLIDGFNGTVNTFRFVNNTLVAGGDFTYQDSELKLLAYDFNSTDQEVPDHFADIDSVVDKLLLVDNSTDGRIIISGDNFISVYDGDAWTDITGDLEGTITDIQLLSLGSSNTKNNESYFDADQMLIAAGNLTLSSYGYVNVAYFNSTDWMPYVVVTQGSATATVNSIFMNKDMSSLYISGTISNTTSPSTTTTSTPSATTTSSSPSKHSSGKMDRGFIVLVGLACAVGTISLLGALAAFFMFRNKEQEYIPLEPRVNETEMLDTVPPENLLKHV